MRRSAGQGPAGGDFGLFPDPTGYGSGGSYDMRRTSRLIMSRRLGLAVLLASGCAAQRPPAVPSMLVGGTSPDAVSAHEDVASVGWLAGRWVSDDGAAEETWTPASDALWGVSWRTAEGRTLEWEALIVACDDA